MVYKKYTKRSGESFEVHYPKIYENLERKTGGKHFKDYKSKKRVLEYFFAFLGLILIFGSFVYFSPSFMDSSFSNFGSLYKFNPTGFAIVQVSGSFVTQISSSNDDASECLEGIGINMVISNSSDIELNYDAWNCGIPVNHSGHNLVGLRFQNVTIPQGATITNATIVFQVDESRGGDATIEIFAEDVDNSPEFSEVNNNLTDRNLTSVNVTYTFSDVSGRNWSVVNDNPYFPNISLVIQEVIDRPGWNSGNSLSILVTSQNLSNYGRILEAYDGEPANAPILRINYLYESEVFVSITDPITSSPTTVSTGDNLTIKFNYSIGGVNQTSGVSVENVTIGGSYTTINSVPGSLSYTNIIVPITVGENDDVEECDLTQDSCTTGDMDLTSSDLELHGIQGDETVGAGYVGLRFNGLIIPQGASIVNATIMFQVDETFTDVPLTVTFYGEDIGNATPYSSTAFNLTDRTKTTAWVNWSIPHWSSVGEKKNTTNLNSIVEEIVGRGDWISGNSLNIMVRDIYGVGQRTAEDGDSAGQGAILYVNYSSVGASTDDVAYVDGNWQVNVTVPTFASGLKDLFVNATRSGITINSTQINAVDYEVGGDSSPVVTLNSPPDSTDYTSSQSVDFNCTVFDDFDLDNVTFYWNVSGSFIANGTDSSGINNSEYSFNRGVNVFGDFAWNCYGVDNSSNGAFASSNRTFSFHQKELLISDPMTASPVSVSSGDNITILFNYSIDGANQTSGVTMENVTIGGSIAPIIGTEAIGISQVGSNVSGQVAIGAGTETKSLPSGLQEGDLVIVLTGSDVFASDEGLGANVEGYTTYTEVSGSNDYIWGYKIMGATPDTEVTLGQASTKDGTFLIQAWRGVDPDNILDVAKPTRTGGTDNTIEPPAITPTTEGALVIAMGFLDDDATIPSGYPSGYTATGYGHTGSSGFTVMMASKTWSSGEETPSAFTVSTDLWTGETIALRPLSGSQEFAYVDGNWQVNVTVPIFESGLKDLFVNATHGGLTANQTQSNAVDYLISDTTAPTYSGNQTNQTRAGNLTEFALLVDDDIALNTNGGYIFSTNNTGTWVNDSLVLFSTTPEWANVTKVLNSTVGTSVSYRWYLNDTSNNANITEVYLVTTTADPDLTSPTYSGNQTNQTTVGVITEFGLNVSDETNLTNGGYIFSTNNTGSWINDSFVAFSSTPEWANVSKTLNSTVGTNVGY